MLQPVCVCLLAVPLQLCGTPRPPPPTPSQDKPEEDTLRGFMCMTYFTLTHTVQRSVVYQAVFWAMNTHRPLGHFLICTECVLQVYLRFYNNLLLLGTAVHPIYRSGRTVNKPWVFIWWRTHFTSISVSVYGCLNSNHCLMPAVIGSTFSWP